MCIICLLVKLFLLAFSLFFMLRVYISISHFTIDLSFPCIYAAVVSVKLLQLCFFQTPVSYQVFFNLILFEECVLLRSRIARAKAKDYNSGAVEVTDVFLSTAKVHSCLYCPLHTAVAVDLE